MNEFLKMFSTFSNAFIVLLCLSSLYGAIQLSKECRFNTHDKLGLATLLLVLTGSIIDLVLI